MAFDYLSAANSGVDSLEISPDLMVLNWNALLLYPAGWQLGPAPVSMNVFADRLELLGASTEQLAAYRALVQQAYRLYGSRHYAHYDFLYALSDLLAHEFTHSWNGKFRRPADLWTPNYNVPMQDSLLWVYEGQTEYWGFVLAARAGLWLRQQTLDQLALLAAYYQMQPGRQWRSLQDTTNDPIINHHRPVSWGNWSRY